MQLLFCSLEVSQGRDRYGARVQGAVNREIRARYEGMKRNLAGFGLTFATG